MKAWERSSWRERYLGKEKRETGKEMGKGRDIFDMSVTEVVRLAIGRNCFRCAVKDATSYGPG